MERPDALSAGAPHGDEASPKGKTMYIGLGTVLFIVVLFLLFRAFSGRRV